LVVFEDKVLADEAVVAVEKAVHHEDMGTLSTKPDAVEVGQVELIETTSKDANAPASKV
jgi:hypothetical protein